MAQIKLLFNFSSHLSSALTIKIKAMVRCETPVGAPVKRQVEGLCSGMDDPAYVEAIRLLINLIVP